MNTTTTIVVNKAVIRRAIAEIVARYNSTGIDAETVDSKMAKYAEAMLPEVVSGAKKSSYAETLGFRVEVERLTKRMVVVNYMVNGSVLFCKLTENGC